MVMNLKMIKFMEISMIIMKKLVLMDMMEFLMDIAAYVFSLLEIFLTLKEESPWLRIIIIISKKIFWPISLNLK